MIEINELSKKYAREIVLDLPELFIPKGQCFGLVGNNGAGKTTFFSLLLDLIESSRGDSKNKFCKRTKERSVEAFYCSLYR